MVTKFRALILSCLFALTLVTSGCISIEQEIYLQADGSGDLLLHISLPDLPEDMKKTSPGEDPTQMLQKFKTEVAQKLPPSITLKEAKESKRNGTQGFYAVFHFTNLKDVETVMAQAMKETTKDPQSGASKPAEWVMRSEKRGNLTYFTQSFLADLSDSKVKVGATAESDNKNYDVQVKAVPSGKATTGQAAARQPKTGKRAPRTNGKASATPAEEPNPFGADFSKQLEPLFFAAIKFRFVVHTPTPIKESNADIVLNGNRALWDASLAAFAKEKKPIEMKVVY